MTLFILRRFLLNNEILRFSHAVIPAAFLSGNPENGKTGFLQEACRNDKLGLIGYNKINTCCYYYELIGN